MRQVERVEEGRDICDVELGKNPAEQRGQLADLGIFLRIEPELLENERDAREEVEEDFGQRRRSLDVLHELGGEGVECLGCLG